MADKEKLFKIALGLSIFTIIFNVAEGLFSIFFGYEDESLTLFGFGIDSFIEVISAIGITQMIIRIRQNPNAAKSKFEIRALRITGFSFYALSVGLLITIIQNIITGHKPESTFWGIVISLISITIMTWLTITKIRTGRKLDSPPIISDGNCSRVCVYMSLVLLAASLIYEYTGFAYADVIGAAGIIYFSVSEGREAFEKARNNNLNADECNCCH